MPFEDIYRLETAGREDEANHQLVKARQMAGLVFISARLF